MTLNKKLIICFSALVIVIVAIIIPLVNLNAKLSDATKSVDLAARNRVLCERIHSAAMFSNASKNEVDAKKAREDMKNQINLLRQSLHVLAEGGNAPEFSTLKVILPADNEERYAITNLLNQLNDLEKNVYLPLINEPKTIAVKINKTAVISSTETKIISADSLIENPAFNEAFNTLIEHYEQRILVNMCVKLTDVFSAKYNLLYLKFNNYLYFCIFAILVCVVLISLIIARAIKRPLNSISEVAREMASGNVSKRINYQSGDEVGEIATHINNLSQTIQHTATFIAAIGNGDIDAEYNVEVNKAIDERNNLPLATLNMRDKLKQVAEEETKRNWVTSGLAKLSEINRTIDSADEKMYDTYLQFIIKYMRANQGGLFIINDDDAFNPLFQLVACVAYNRKKYLEKELPLTEGLIGQCYLENEIIYITDLPQTHLTITSGLGESMPRCLILLPLKTNDKTIGVIELASFEDMDEYKLEFLKKSCESIATLIVGLKTNIKTNKLLMQTQQQTEEMRAQEEEMRQNMEELMATQEELDRKQFEMDARIDAINRSIATIEFNMDGIILTANDKFIKIFNYTRADLQGKHQHIFLEPALRYTEAQEQFWNDLRNGASIENQFKYQDVEGKTVWLSGIYAPVFDRNNLVVKVILFARNITAQKLAESK